MTDANADIDIDIEAYLDGHIDVDGSADIWLMSEYCNNNVYVITGLQVSVVNSVAAIIRGSLYWNLR